MADYSAPDDHGATAGLNPEIPESVLQRLTREVRFHYVAKRRELFPTYKPDAKRWAPVWRRAAEACFVRHIEPEALAAAAFQLYRPYPHPNMLLSRRTLEKATGGEVKNDSHFYHALRYKGHLDSLRRGLNAGQSLDDVLCSESCSMDALFRFAAARAAGRDDLCQLFYSAAVARRATAATEYLHLFSPDLLP